MEGEKEACMVCNEPMADKERYYSESKLSWYHYYYSDCIEALKSRLSSLEAALSLEPEHVERICIQAIQSNPADWEKLSLGTQGATRSFAIKHLKIIRKLAGLTRNSRRAMKRSRE